ncbi:hypothetical protein FAM22277_00121 [Lacticaseibacillus paracasei]|jgi:hypothetical protein|nr:hypothetical protein FAM22277_00121 [Lacticaseibacillus paracasei]
MQISDFVLLDADALSKIAGGDAYNPCSDWIGGNSSSSSGSGPSPCDSLGEKIYECFAMGWAALTEALITASSTDIGLQNL